MVQRGLVRWKPSLKPKLIGSKLSKRLVRLYLSFPTKIKQSDDELQTSSETLRIFGAKADFECHIMRLDRFTVFCLLEKTYSAILGRARKSQICHTWFKSYNEKPRKVRLRIVPLVASHSSN